MNQNQNQRYECYKAFTGYEVRMDFRINGIYALRHRPGYECLLAFNQRYNAREGITGVEYAAKPHLPVC